VVKLGPHFLPVAFCCAGLVGCALFPSHRALRQCRFEALAYNFTGIDPKGLAGTVTIKAVNPASSRAKIHRLKLVLVHEGDTLAQALNDSLLYLPARDSLVLPMRVLVPYSALGALALPLALGQNLDCQLQGEAYIATPFGTYTVRKAIQKKVMLDLGRVKSGLRGLLGV